MKTHIMLIIILGLSTAAGYGQSFQDLASSIGPEAGLLDDQLEGWDMAGMAGLLIEENPLTGETAVYAQIGFQPEFGLGPFGIGLDITLTYDIENGELRESDYNENEDYLKLIRYIRYGSETEGPYLKAGAIDSATLGHGFILNRYKTDVDYDNRRAGLQFNMNYEYWGLESFTNNLFLGEVAGARVVYRPLAGNPLPVIGNLGIGLSAARDSNAPHILQDDETYDTATESWSLGPDGQPDWDDDGIYLIEESQTISIYGADLEIPVIRKDMLGLTLYADYAEFRNVGSESGKFSDGVAMGMMFHFKLFGGNKLYLKAEERFHDQNFIPGYFGRMYEIERLQFLAEFPLLTKQAYLESLPDDGRYKGIYGEIAFEILNTFEVWGTYEDKLDVPDDGSLQMGLGLKRLAGIRAGATYTKTGIDDSNTNDIFTMDDRSLFMAYLSYQLTSLIEVGTIFRRNWELDMGSGEFVPVDSYTAGVSFNTTF